MLGIKAVITDGGDHRGFQGFIAGHRRQDAGQTRSQHGFTRAGRPQHEHGMSAGGGDFQCTLGLGLTTNLTEVGSRRVLLQHCGGCDGQQSIVVQMGA